MVWLYWVVCLTFVTLLSAFIVRRWRHPGYTALVAFYVIYLGASQILATRIVEFDLVIRQFYAPAAVFLYPFIAQALDMINEVYGRRLAQLAILIAFVTQVLLVLFILLVRTLQPAPFFEYERAWQFIFGLSIRITVASWVAFLVCQTIDVYVFDWLKRKFERNVILRSVTSDVIDLTLDSAIFVTVAFAGVMPLLPLIIGQIVSKNFIGFIDTPWFLLYKRLVK